MATPTIPRQSSEDHNPLTQVISHGRGGAGNIGTDEHPYDESPEDLRIPTLKTLVYTTGRGGTGNMAINDLAHPELARAAQDVEEEPRRPGSSDSFHGGRGGAGNIVHSTDSDLTKPRFEEEERQCQTVEIAKPAPIDHDKVDYRGWADKGKAFLMERVAKKKGGSK
ncbi:hypothetical protein L873DRAFT_1488231 [Choiromyces venosus 120613-1]|uniref:Uncharacterized protein n=1 Tax=Choiromyces venosus 120613-1 TaxID=1336337 RepID=A0A3N4J6S5_9PEZI|nr:hypothetical protein L873DRAFT_1488231 [Choiromyces venosus 120613-1]